MPKKRKKKNLLLMTLIIGGMFGTPNLAGAADTTWTGGAGTSDWFTALNWDTEAVPSTAYNAFINTTDETIEITGAAAEAYLTHIGYEAGSSGSLLLSGTSASLTNTGQTTVGYYGNGSLLVTKGATLSNSNTYIGKETGSVGSAAISNSTWTNSGFISTGHSGTGTLTISDASTITSTYVLIGYNAGSNGIVTIKGTGSTWTASEHFLVGAWGEGTLYVLDGATISVGEQFIVGQLAGGTGTAIISGAGSRVSVGTYIYVANLGTGYLTVENGGYLYVAQTIDIGQNEGTTAILTVTGSGSRVELDGDITTGNYGNGTLTISDGGNVITQSDAFIARRDVATGRVTVTGASSSFSGTGSLYVANYGTGYLTISDGGSASFAAVYIGRYVGAEGSVIVTGTNSLLESDGYLYVGVYGTGYLQILDGAKVTAAGITTIGNSSGSNGSILVSGAGSSLIVSQTLLVGHGWNGAATGSLTISDGGTVSVTDYIYIGNHNSSTGTVLVTGTNSLLESDTVIRVGNLASGALTVSNDGMAQADGNLEIAYYSGSTGTLNIGSASGAEAVAPGTISAASLTFGSGTGTLVFNHTSSSYTFDLAMSSGSGTSSILVESGFTTLTADSSGFTGTTTVSGGTLSVNGSLGGTITVTSGGRLQGTGTMSTVVIESGGTFAPGNSVGTTTVASLTLESGSSLEIEIDGTGSDVINVTGTLTNNGGDVVITMDEGVSLSTSSSYNYLTYASLSGSSVSVTVEDSLPFLTTTASSTGTTTSVAFSRNATSFASLASTDNQLKVASVLSGLSSGDLYQGLISVKNADLARAAYDQLSGALHANVKLSLLADNKDEIFASRLEEAPSPYVQAIGQWTRRDGHSRTSGFSGNSRGILIGQERQIDKDKIFGFAVHYQKANYEEEANLYADATVKGYGASLYGQMPYKYQTQLKAGLSYSYHDIESKREIAISGYSDNPTGDYEAHKLETFIEAAKPYAWGEKGNIEPYGRVNLSAITIPGFKETGGEAALDMQQSKDAMGKTAIGLRFKGELPFENDTNKQNPTNKAIFKAHLGWEHIVGDLTTSSTGHLATLQDASISAAPLARDSVALGAQMQLHYGQSLNIGLRYAGTLAASSASHAVMGSISAKF